MLNLLSFDLAGIAAILLAIISIVTTIIDKRSTSRKNKIDILNQLQDLMDSTISRNAQLLTTVVELRAEMAGIQGDMKLLATLSIEWIYGIEILHKQIKRARGNPEWTPDTVLIEKIKVKYGIRDGYKINESE